MVRIILIFLFLFFTTNASPNNKEKIIQNLRYTQNLQFNFEQNINGKIENGKRVPKKNNDFGEKFIELARNVYKYNDQRAKIKSAINDILNSNIREVKSYN